MNAAVVTQTDNEIDKRGRPCKYDTHIKPYLEQIFEWLCKGYTDYSISEQLGIHQNTWMRYKDKYSVLGELYARARTQKNALVMHSMFKKATGIVQMIPQQKVTKDGDIVDYTETIYVPPDVNAADLYLRNNDENYKSAKSEPGNLTLIQNNFQLPQISQQLKEIENQLKSLESPSAVDVEAIE
jgi:hypothetical protein